MAQIDVISFEQIAKMLSQLATNYSNLFADYYNLFYNPTPMDVTVELYDDSGNLETITIPNRAKDRTYILNGEGEPEGVVEAEKGSVYQDLSNGIVYIKQFTTSDSTGWSELMTIGSLSEYLLQDAGSPEGVVTATKGVLYVDRGNANLYIKTTNIGNTGWNLISANTTDLANIDLSNLSDVGNNKFLNKSLGNLDTIGRSIIDGKENVNNKKSEWTNNINNTYYPTTKLVYDTINNLTSVLADKNLSNLNQEGEDHFVRTLNQVRDCIFKAPNGLPSLSGNIISLPAGTIILCANGVNADNSKNNSRVTVDSTLSVSVSWTTANNGIIFYNNTNTELIYYNEENYFRQISAPSGSTNMIWYNPNTNEYKLTSNSGSTWTTIVAAEIGRFTTNSSGNTTSFESYHPLAVAMEDDINSLKSYTDKEKVDRGDLVEVHCVIETYYNNGNWYRLYDDKWCEQGGIINVNYNNTYTEVSLLKNFADTNYNILLSPGGAAANGTLGASWQDKTTSKFNIWGDYNQSSASSIPTTWEAKGYIS